MMAPGSDITGGLREDEEALIIDRILVTRQELKDMGYVS